MDLTETERALTRKYPAMLIKEILREADEDADDRTYEAVIQHANGDQDHVTIEAENSFDAEDQIIARYCDGDPDRLIEGPWVKHESDG